MMPALRHRYPGAQPFRDDEFSSRTFFGREEATVALTDQILANQLVVVYAKSGLGKTSLLNAGVAPQLRAAGSIPLFVRVNNTSTGLLGSVIESVRAEAERQKIECHGGDDASLWSFFKTVEFWRDDILLNPVLIIDQFEELFTLQAESVRDLFLAELSFVLRGIQPVWLEGSGLRDETSFPPFHLVLSLREDFLGLLEDAATHIPQIMNHRYRVTPLSYELASTAITGPAELDEGQAAAGAIATRAFRLEPLAVTAILDYLTAFRAARSYSPTRNIEPFHLQLICQRIERVAQARQETSDKEVVLRFRDIGGYSALAETLKNFYSNALRSVSGRRTRNAVRMLCEQLLISPEGRRLSVEEREISRQLRLAPAILQQLVDSRLLRTDRRSESTYYELSHDALVEPVLEGTRLQAMVIGGVSSLAGWLAFLVGGLAISFALIALFLPKTSTLSWIDEITFCVLFFIFGTVALTLGRRWARAGRMRQERYRRHIPGEVSESSLPLRKRLPNRILIRLGQVLIAVWGGMGLLGAVILLSVVFAHGDVPDKFSWLSDDVKRMWQIASAHPLLELAWRLVEYGCIAVTGWLLYRRGNRKLEQLRSGSQPAAVLSLARPSGLVSAVVRYTLGVLVFWGALYAWFAVRKCTFGFAGVSPDFARFGMLSATFLDACTAASKKSLTWENFTFALFVLSAFVLAALSIHSGASGWWRDVRERNLLLPVGRRRRNLALNGVVALLILLAPWAAYRMLLMHEQAVATSRSLELYVGRAVGDDATVLHFTGTEWESQNSGTGTFFDVAMGTRNIGWAVGGGGSIWRTEDGTMWKPQTSGVKKPLRGVTAIDRSTAWVVGDDGTILSTKDGGEIWNSQRTMMGGDLNAVTFVSPQSGWAVGNSGSIFHTTDGGTTWKWQNSVISENLNAVSFASATSGYAVSAEGSILHTVDAGATWGVLRKIANRRLNGITFATVKDGWAVGSSGEIVHTTDGGAAWKLQTSPTQVELMHVFAISSRMAWAVGGEGTVLHTENSGNSWIQESSGTKSDLLAVGFRKVPR